MSGTGNATAIGMLTFANPPMLGWCAAAIVPLVIHFWTRRRYREVEWAAMSFLLAALRKNMRRLRIEQFLLLLARMLIFVLFGMALAEPRWREVEESQQKSTARRTHHILVIDGSFSMSTSGVNRSRFERARSRARDLVNNAPQGDAFSLMVMAAEPVEVIGHPSFARPQVLAEVDALQWQPEAARLQPTLVKLDELLTTERRQYPQLKTTEVWMLSDFAAHTWDDATGELCAPLLQRLERRCTIHWEDVGDEAIENIAVAALRPDDGQFRVAEPFALTAEIRNYGSSSATRTVQFLADGQLIEERSQTFSVGPNNLRFEHTWDLVGDRIVEVRTTADSLSVDDVAWLSIPVLERSRVLCLEGSVGSAHYVERALTSTAIGRNAMYEVERTSELRVEDLDRDFDLIFLCDVPPLPADYGAGLRRAVANGACVIWSMGENGTSSVADVQAGLDSMHFPARVIGLRGDGQHFFAADDYAHPIIAPFRGFERSGLLTAPSWKYVELEPLTSANVVLRFDTGAPAIVEASSGSGRTIVFTTALSPDAIDRSVTQAQPWSMLATWPCFPPLIHEAARFGMSGRILERNHAIGDVLSGVVPRGVSADSLQVQLPDGRVEPVTAVAREGRYEWLTAPARQPGVYRLVKSDSDLPIASHVVNLDHRDSDPRRFDPTLLPQTQGTVGGIPSERETRFTSGPDGHDFRMARIMLSAALVMLLVERWLASRSLLGFVPTSRPEVRRR